MRKINSHEQRLFSMLYEGVDSHKRIKIIGPPPGPGERSPTLSFTLEGKTASEVCQQLASRHIYAWDGHFYAIRVCEVLGLMEIGGVTRMGISAYTNEEDIKRTLATLKELL
jgi:selenocysteine lyase/cysteine desulfurase